MESTPAATLSGHPYTKVLAVYDAQGRRIARTIWQGGTAAVPTFKSNHRYHYDGWNVISEYSSPSATGVPPVLSQTLTWGLDLSNTPQGAGGVGGLLSLSLLSSVSESSVSESSVSESSVFYPSYDGNGNITAWSQKTSTAPTARREYDAFGNTLVSEGNWPSSYGFSTKPQDTETGLYYYGYRYYDPVTGRWPSRDPIEEEGGVNLYGFVGNDAITFVDMYGLLPISVFYTFSNLSNVSIGDSHQPGSITTAGHHNGDGIVICEYKKCKMECIVVARSRILMNTASVIKGTKDYIESLNHEKMHMMSWGKKIKRDIVGGLIMEKIECSNDNDCSVKAKELTDKYEKLIPGLKGGDHRLVDSDLTPYSPIVGGKYSSSSLAGLIPKWTTDMEMKKNLEASKNHI